MAKLTKAEKKLKKAEKKAEKLALKSVDKSIGTHNHLKENKNLKHKDFPLFLRMNFEEAGEEINS